MGTKFQLMKKTATSFSVFLLMVVLISCGGKGSYYEQLTNDKAFASRALDLNKTIDEIRKEENGKLIRDDINLLKYVYEIGKNDTYQVTYQFDEQGCWEIGIDCYFEKEEDAQNVVDGIRSEITATAYGSPTEDNSLCRWKSPDKSASIEVDYKETSRGLVILTIMAN